MTVQRAIGAIAAGRPVVAVGREGEGALVFAAARATPELVAFTVRHTSGFLCVALPGQTCDRLLLPPMRGGRDRVSPAYRVTVDACGTGTGISARDRARTIAALASPEADAEDFVRPGHVVPVRAREGGVLYRPGIPELAVELARSAELGPVGAWATLVSRERPVHTARGSEPARFAVEHGLELISAFDLAARHAQLARFVSSAR